VPLALDGAEVLVPGVVEASGVGEGVSMMSISSVMGGGDSDMVELCMSNDMDSVCMRLR
jgi:hypothetical protein